MFIENNKNNVYLAKKIDKKKISISLRTKKISVADIKELSEKEFDLLSSLQNYQNFSKILYNKQSLDKLVKSEVFYYNLVDSSLKTPTKEKYKSFPIYFIYESNRTEGSKIPLEEVKKIYDDKKYSYKVKNEIQEVQNSIEAREYLQKGFLFNQSHIKKIYHILTKDLLQENGLKYPRGFKKVKNVVNDLPTTDPKNVSLEITHLLDSYKTNRSTMSPIQLAFDFHLSFEKIHPFENGNGRVGRLLMNKILIAHGFLPFVIFSANREAYFNAIKSTYTGSAKKYYAFMMEQYRKSLVYFSK